MARLTDKQTRFVDEYLVDLNATQAAIRAGYSKNRASELGYQLLQKTTVQEAIRKAMKDREQRTQITQDRVLQELAAVGFSKTTDFVKIDKQGRVLLTPTDELTEEQQRAVAGIKDGKYGVELKLYDKVRALEKLGEHLGLFENKANQKTTGENNLLEAIKNVEEIGTDDLPEVE